MTKLKDKTIYPVWDMEVKGGEIVMKDEQAFEQYLAAMEGRENLQLTIKRKVKSRSRQEEKYYHAVVVRMVADAMGLMDEEAHQVLRGLFLRIEESQKLKDGRVVRYERTMSTTELGDRDYRDYWEKVVKWAALPTKDGLGPDSGLGLYIPMPNEADWWGKEEYQHIP